MTEKRQIDRQVAERLGLVGFGSWPEHDIHTGGWYCSHCTSNIVWCGRCKQEWCPDCHDIRDDRDPPPQCKKEPPRFSEDITAAWTLVEYMRTQGWSYEVRDTVSGRHTCVFFLNGMESYERTDDTPAEAIAAAFVAVAAGREGTING